VSLTAARTPAQDMLALPAEVVGPVLQRFLRDERTLKVGTRETRTLNSVDVREVTLVEQTGTA